MRAGEGATKGAGAKKKQKFNLMPPRPLTNFEISEYYKNEPRFNSVYSRDNLPKTSTVKKGAYAINLDEYTDIGTHWIALYIKTNEVIYFDSFGVEHIPKEIKKIIGNEQSSNAKALNKDIKANIFRLEAYDSIMCGYFCVEFINYMFDCKSLIDFTNLFSHTILKRTIKLLKSYLNQ